MNGKVVSSSEADYETRACDEHHQSIRLFLRLIACTRLIEDSVRSRLRTELKITLPCFDLLAQLERMPGGLRMVDLSRRMMVTTGNVTGITNRLVAEGFVVREQDPKDLRACRVTLTPEGEKVLKRVTEKYEARIVEVYSSMSETDHQQIYAILGMLKKHAEKAQRCN